MGSITQNSKGLGEIPPLVERIKRGNCVLVLGPRVALRTGGPDLRPLDEILASELITSIENVNNDDSAQIKLRRAAELYYRERKDREALELFVQEFYKRESNTTTDFHKDLAQLPFKLCINTSPDDYMFLAFQKADKSPQKGFYNFKQSTQTKTHLFSPNSEKPLIYHLFGHSDELSSLVLTEGDLIDFLVSLVRGNPPVPDQVRSILADPAVSFLFLGFGFQNWYLRVLLQVMNIYGHRSKAVAVEDNTFFDDPKREQTIEFFSGDRRIDFTPVPWHEFAQHLRKEYVKSLPQNTTTPASASLSSPLSGATSPKAFLSYASEDRIAVEDLGRKLEDRGINVWQDKQDLRVGDDWKRVLISVIEKRVDYFIFVQSNAMTNQIEGVFNLELKIALERHELMNEFDGQKLSFLMAVRLGDCTLNSKVKQLHIIDVSDDAGVETLATSILEDWAKRKELTTRQQGVA